MNTFYNSTEIINILHGYNPWWQGREVVIEEFKRLAYHSCRRFLEDKSLKRAIFLSGPRRVGKTTILNQMAHELLGEGVEGKSLCYISLDHPLLKLVTLAGILRIYHENIFPEGMPVILLLDEVQYSTDWELELKQLIDHKPQYRILATGSASVIYRQKLAESGVGRWVRVPIPTLSFFEFLSIRKAVLPEIEEELRPNSLFSMSREELRELDIKFRHLMPLFLNYLLVGGFPETAMQKDIALSQRLLREDVVERVLKRDMTMLFGVRNVDDLEKLFIYTCLHSGDIFSVQSVASALGVSHITVTNHLEILEQANLIYRLPPIGVGGKKVLKARYKVYLVDAALRNAMLLRGEESLSNAVEVGSMVETTILRHLYAYHYQDVPTISYWRDAVTEKEVDIIVKSPKYQIPVEVKYRDNVTITEKEGILTYCKQEGISKGYWITKGSEYFGVEEFEETNCKILKIPAHIFTYLLGQTERIRAKLP